MPQLTPDEMNNLIKEAGVGPRTARKLHKANGTDDGSPATPAKPATERPVGHGAARPPLVSLGSDF